MVVFYFIGLIISCLLVFTGKGIADIVSDETNWKASVFANKGDEGSYWGHKDATHTRKDHENKILNYLLHTLFVPFTDIWHSANTIRRFGIYLSILFALLIGNSIELNLLSLAIIIGTYIALNMVGFHMMYSKFLRK